MNEFEWSESGSRLLATIERIIEENGGVEEMYKLVSREMDGNLYKISKQNMMHRIKLIRGRVPHSEMPNILGISYHEMYKLIREMDLLNTI